MMTFQDIRGFIALVLAPVAAVGCSQDDSSAVSPESPAAPTATQTAAPDAGPLPDAQVPPEAGPSPADGGPLATGCPTGLPGPQLIPLPAADGKYYCMDQRETTWQEYQVFAQQKGKDLSGQPKFCDWNDSYQPSPPDGSDDLKHIECPQLTWDALQKDANLPAMCVDFCDAWAYCAWSGKRLCSETGSSTGQVHIANADEALANAAGQTSEWTHACSQGGKTQYPFGDALVEGKCIDQAWLDANKSAAVADVENRTCHGTILPYKRIYDLYGSVGEWVNSCDGDVNCVVRGASPYIKGLEKHCGAEAGIAIKFSQRAAYGIRCCADAIAPAN